MLSVHAVEGLRASACLLLVAMLSIATYPTDHLASVLSHPRPAIALDAISNLLFYYIIF